MAGSMMIDMLNNKHFVLVHGIVTGQGKLKGMKIGHAWIEIGDMVLDYSHGRRIVMKKKQYYRMGKIKKVRRYTVKEASKLMFKSKD